MSTNCKLIFGYTDHMGYWNVTKEYVRWQDGYSEAVLPALKYAVKFNLDLKALNEKMGEHHSWRFEEIPDEESYQYGNMNYHYYIDMSNRARIYCTVLTEDHEFYNKFGVMNMVVEQELILND